MASQLPVGQKSPYSNRRPNITHQKLHIRRLNTIFHPLQSILTRLYQTPLDPYTHSILHR